MNATRSAPILVLAALHAPGAFGQTDAGALKEVAIDALKMTYLSCDRAATRGELGTAAIMQCSVVYEELKRRAFDGDFEKFRAWSASQSNIPGSRQR